MGMIKLIKDTTMWFRRLPRKEKNGLTKDIDIEYKAYVKYAELSRLGIETKRHVLSVYRRTTQLDVVRCWAALTKDKIAMTVRPGNKCQERNRRRAHTCFVDHKEDICSNRNWIGVCRYTAAEVVYFICQELT